MKNLKHFYFDIVFTTVALMAAAYWGYTHGGVTAIFSALFVTLVLALMEISLSFDNAVVNASVLKNWENYFFNGWYAYCRVWYATGISYCYSISNC